MITMNSSMTERSGILALLGSEGLHPHSTPVWQRIFALAPGRLDSLECIPTALATQNIGTADRRTRIAAERLASLGVEATTTAIFSREDAAQPSFLEALEVAPAFYLLGGEPRVLASILKDTPAWEIIRRRYAGGMPLIAAGGAAAALGTVGVAPCQPYPASLNDLSVETYVGLGLLSGLVILPYYSWLPDALVNLIRASCPAGSALIGLDDQAALIRTGKEWHAEGSGSIILLSKNSVQESIDAGQPVPDSWFLPPRMEGPDA